MKVKVDHQRCQGHARCYALAPQLFTLDDNGYIRPGDIEVPVAEEALAQRAARACPERAITVEAEESSDARKG